MIHPSVWRLVIPAAMLSVFLPAVLHAQTSPHVIWFEPGVPSADSAAPTAAQLADIFPGARIASTDQLGSQLTDPQTRLLILPFGSVVPASAWSAISDFLHRGGNLLVLGGRPFTRAAYHDASGWHLREYSTRFSRLLLIDQYQSTPGSDGLTFTVNSDQRVGLTNFNWKQAFSPIIRLSTSDIYPRGGSAGTLDVKLDALVWGVSVDRKVSAPLIQMDHISSGFDGGRWIFLSADLAPDFYSSRDSRDLLRTLADRALEGALEFSVRPTLPLYLPGEPVEIETIYHAVNSRGPAKVKIICYPAERNKNAPLPQPNVIDFPTSTTTLLPAPTEKGLYFIEAQLFEGTFSRAIYRSGFWIRDETYLRSGPKLGVNADYFAFDGRPLAVIGTTYMSSDVQRLYFGHPNVYIWNRDLAQIHSAGLNMIRTGWWTGWDKLCDETGRPYEGTLRTLEAYLMTARKYGLPVQFNFFAFLPEILGGVNAYLDGEAVRKQQNLVRSVAARFAGVPFIAWDLINEPSFSKYLWRMRPNGDAIELAAWNAWLAQKYPDRAALAAAWSVPPDSVTGTIALPSEEEFNPRGVYTGTNSLRVYDYTVFAQEKFADWVYHMREAIRNAGSQQPITVGQDEGGFVDRLNPSFFASHVDFTTNHSWWQNDFLLWDSLVAKQPGKAMLIQETGIQRELTPNEIARLTPEQEAALFERKVALSFAYGSGAIQWLWNSNSYMTESNETPIGALRSDGTEKPEATILRNFAKFAAAASPYFNNPKTPDIAIVTSQAAQYSALGQLQIAAQQNAVRALAYGLHQPCYIIAENQIASLGAPKLVIVPSPQALREFTWQALLTYVRKGGNLLVTGPVSRDEHFQRVDRYSALGFKAHAEPLTFHTATSTITLGASVALPPDFIDFDQQAQQLLEVLDFEDGSAMKSLPVGQGQLFWAAYPIELSETSSAVVFLYRQLIQRANLAPARDSDLLSGNGLLVLPIELQDGVLYILESESDQDTDLDFRDTITGAELKLRLPSQRAALAIIDKHSTQLAARYGF